MLLNELKPRYLVLGNTFDDFSIATDKINYDEEDLCCQVIEHTTIYYWINTESVWGPIGFVWEKYENNGYFSTSNLNYNIIPKIPDSKRHKNINKLLRNRTKDIEVLDSGWEHFTNCLSLIGKQNSFNIIFHIDSLIHLNINGSTSSNINTLNTIRTKYTFKCKPCIIKIYNIITTINESDNIKLHILNSSYDNYSLIYINNENNDVFDYKTYFTNLPIFNINRNQKGVTININKIVPKMILKPCLFNTSLNTVVVNNYIINHKHYILDELIYEDLDYKGNGDTIDMSELKFNFSLNVYTKKLTINRNYLCFNYYWHYCIFDELEEITETIINKSEENVLYFCKFNSYPYGEIDYIEKIFNNCEYCGKINIISDYNYKNNDFYLHKVKNALVDCSEGIQLRYLNDNERRGRIIIKNINNNTYNSIYIKVKIDSNFIYTKGNLYMCYVEDDIKISEFHNIVYLGYGIIKKQILEITNKIDTYFIYCLYNFTSSNIKFTNTKENVINNNIKINTIYYNYHCSLPQYWIANTSYTFNTDISDANNTLPSEDNDIFIYNSNITCIIDKYNSTRFKLILDNIHVELDKPVDKIIKLLSKYYQTISSEKIDELIENGYTIIEVL